MTTVALFGASVRALAESVIRAGDVPLCFDLFADQDLKRVAHAVAIDRDEYPHGFIRHAETLPGIPRLYVGGLENYPDVLQRLAEKGPLWGCGARVTTRVRSPAIFAKAVRGPGVEPPDSKADADGLAPDGSYLVKPLAGSAGRSIHHWFGGPIPSNSYLQRMTAGDPWSAAFLATHDGCTFLGSTRQLVGEAWCNAAPFAYCGSIGPLPLGPNIDANLAAAGERCVRAFGLLGLFGIDFLLDDSTVRPVEINPRYTASMEVFERALEVSFYALHRSTFVAGLARPIQREPTKVVGKAVLFARCDCRFSFRSVNLRPLDGAYADLPTEGCQIAPGEPVLTILAEGRSEGECLQRLKQLAGEFEEFGCMPIC